MVKNKLIGKCFKNKYKTVGKITDVYLSRGIEYIEYVEFSVNEYDDTLYYTKFLYEKDIWRVGKKERKESFFEYFTIEITEQEFKDFIIAEVKKEIDFDGN